MSAIAHRHLPLIAPLLLLACVSAALAGEAFPGQLPDRNTLKIQQQVDELFDKGDFKRALFIYEHELAPRGDKYAQYMVGFMHLAGKGVDEDIVTASAWYRLAAERGQETYVRVRNQLMQLLSAEQQALSDARFTELRAQLGDAALIMKLLEQDVDALSSRIRAEPFTQDTFRRSDFDRSDMINRKRAKLIRERLDYLEIQYASDTVYSAREIRRFEALRRRVLQELQEFDEPL